MKKLMIMIAALATGFLGWAEDAVKDQFVPSEWATDAKWLWNGAERGDGVDPTEEEANVVSDVLQFKTGSNKLNRKFAAQPVEVEGAIYLDTTVNFKDPCTEILDTATDAKLAAFLLDPSEMAADQGIVPSPATEDFFKTNLFVIGGFYVGKTIEQRVFMLNTADFADTFANKAAVRLTVKAYENVTANDTCMGFRFFLNGQSGGTTPALAVKYVFKLLDDNTIDLKNDVIVANNQYNYLGLEGSGVQAAVKIRYQDKSLLLSQKATGGELVGMDFMGTGALAALKLTTNADDFDFIADDSSTFDVVLSNTKVAFSGDSFIAYDDVAGKVTFSGSAALTVTATPDQDCEEIAKWTYPDSDSDITPTEGFVAMITPNDGATLTISYAKKVAEVDGTPYASFEEALEAAKTTGGTIKLFDDVTVADQAIIVTGGPIVIDLAGNTLKGEGGGLGSIYNMGTLTITNSTGEGHVAVPTSGAVSIINVGTLTIQAGIMEGAVLTQQYQDEGSPVTTITGGQFNGAVTAKDAASTIVTTGGDFAKSVFTTESAVPGVPTTGYEVVDTVKTGYWTVREKTIQKGTVIFICEKPALSAEPFEAEVGETITFPTKENFVFSNWTNGEGQVVTKVPDGTIQLSPRDIDINLDKDGSGNYEIAKKEDLQTLQAVVNAGFDCAGKTFKQTANIDMTGLLWTGIGNKAGTLYFAGTYDGNGQKIENVMLDATAGTYMGFFRHVKRATIKDLTIETDGFGNLPTDGFGGNYEYGGAVIVGIAVNSTLSGLTANGQLGTATDPLSHNGGGICVEMLGGSIESCTNNVNVYCAYSKIAGICVFTRAEAGKYLDDNKTVRIENCVNNGNFTGITCYTNGSVRVNKGVPGAKLYKAIASDGYAGIISWIGSDAGQTNIINNCANSGTITVDQDAIDSGTAFIGGIIGEISGEVEGSGNTCNAALPLVGAIYCTKTWTDFWYESIATGVATQDTTALAAGQTRVIAVGSGKTPEGLPKPEFELAAGEDITFITNLCVTALDFKGITAATGADLGSEVVAGGVKFTATASGPTPVDPTDADVTEDPSNPGTWNVTPKGDATTISMNGVTSDMTIQIVSDKDVIVTGVEAAAARKVVINGVDITAYVVGGDTAAGFNTALDTAKVQETISFEATGDGETAEKPFVIDDTNVSLGVTSKAGLTYQLIKAATVDATTWTAAGEKIAGTGETIQLQAEKDTGSAYFYKVQVTKTPVAKK